MIFIFRFKLYKMLRKDFKKAFLDKELEEMFDARNHFLKCIFF